MTVQDLLDYLATRNIGPEDYDREHIYVERPEYYACVHGATMCRGSRGVILTTERQD